MIGYITKSGILLNVWQNSEMRWSIFHVTPVMQNAKTNRFINKQTPIMKVKMKAKLCFFVQFSFQLKIVIHQTKRMIAFMLGPWNTGVFVSIFNVYNIFHRLWVVFSNHSILFTPQFTVGSFFGPKNTIVYGVGTVNTAIIQYTLCICA